MVRPELDRLPGLKISWPRRCHSKTIFSILCIASPCLRISPNECISNGSMSAAGNQAGRAVLLTVHGEYSLQKLLPEERVRYDQGELVVRSGVSEGLAHIPWLSKTRVLCGRSC